MTAIPTGRERHRRKEQFERNRADPPTTTPAELGKLMQVELAKYSKVIKAANIQLK